MALGRSIGAMLACGAALLVSATCFASSLDKVQFIKIAPQDEKAVIKGADGKLRIIKPGDVVGDAAKVVSISAGRIVLEEKTDKGLETVIVRIESGKQRIERISKQPDSAQAPLSAASATGKSGTANK